jgi:hypothetical protein
MVEVWFLVVVLARTFYILRAFPHDKTTVISKTETNWVLAVFSCSAIGNTFLLIWMTGLWKIPSINGILVLLSVSQILVVASEIAVLNLLSKVALTQRYQEENMEPESPEDSPKSQQTRSFISLSPSAMHKNDHTSVNELLEEDWE